MWGTRGNPNSDPHFTLLALQHGEWIKGESQLGSGWKNCSDGDELRGKFPQAEVRRKMHDKEVDLLVLLLRGLKDLQPNATMSSVAPFWAV